MYLLAIHMSSLENSWVFFKLSLNISASFTNLQRFFKKYLLIYLAAPGLSCSMWDLVPWPGIEPGPPALGAERVNHRTSREVPAEIFFKPKVLFCTYSVHCIYLLSYFFPSIQHSISTFFPAPTGILLVMLSKTMRRSSSETLGKTHVPCQTLLYSFPSRPQPRPFFEAAPSGLFFSESWTVCAAANSIHNYKASFLA